MCTACDSCLAWMPSISGWSTRASMNGQIAPPAMPKYRSTPVSSNHSAIASTTLIRSSCVGSLPPRQHEQARLGHVLDRPAEPLASQAGVLDAAERHVVDPVGRSVVDDHSADVQALECAPGVVEVVGEEAGLEP